MTVIKFKFWHIEQKRFHDPFAYSVSGDGKVLFMDGHDVTGYVIPLQFTGSKDIHGQEIYEGDQLLVDDDGGKYETVVERRQGALSIEVLGCDYDYTTLGWTPDYLEFEIIGNKWENSELTPPENP